MSSINLHLGDSLEAMKEMEDNEFHLAIVDPPYGIGADNPSKKTAGVRQKNGRVINTKVADYGSKDWDKIPENRYFLEVQRVSKNQIIWGVNYFDFHLGSGRIVWDKMNDASNQFDCEIAYQSFHYDTRLVYYMWSGMLQGIVASNKISVANRQIGDKKKNEKRIHPTQKPVALYKWLLKNYAKLGDKILDTHAGSFSIGIACHDMGFDLEAYEIDEDYYNAALKRFEDHTKQYSLFQEVEKTPTTQLKILE